MPQLSLSQRMKIELQLAEGESYAAIAREIGVHRSTVKREIDRNSQHGQYDALLANNITAFRKKTHGYLSSLPNRELTFDHFDPKPEKSKIRPKTQRRFYKPRGRQYRSYQHNTSPCTFEQRLSPKAAIGSKRRKKAAWLSFNNKYRRYPQYYRPYVDLRTYREHPHKNRSEEYRRRKRRHDIRFRWRNYTKEEASRYRSRATFLMYNLGPRTRDLSHFEQWRSRERRFYYKYLKYLSSERILKLNRAESNYRLFLSGMKTALLSEKIAQQDTAFKDLCRKYAATKSEALRLTINDLGSQQSASAERSQDSVPKKEPVVHRITFSRPENSGKLICADVLPLYRVKYARPPTSAGFFTQKLPVRCRSSGEQTIFLPYSPAFTLFLVQFPKFRSRPPTAHSYYYFHSPLSFTLSLLLHLLMRMWWLAGSQ